jgi:hypothetical protein
VGMEAQVRKSVAIMEEFSQRSKERERKLMWELEEEKRKNQKQRRKERDRRQGPADGREQDTNAHPAICTCRAPMAQLGREVGSSEQKRGCQLSGRSWSADDDNKRLDGNINVEQQRNANASTWQHVYTSAHQGANTATRQRGECGDG